MQPRIMTFRARSMQDALQQIRHELGEDAVVVGREQFVKRHVLPWRRQSWVEVTAHEPEHHVEPLVSAAFRRLQQTHGDNAASDPPTLVDRRLDSIEHLIRQLGQAQTENKDDIPAELFGLFTELIDADVEDVIARDLILCMRNNNPSDVWHDAEKSRSHLAVAVESELHCSGPIQPRPGTPRVVALVGPTGVGKTTTIAKLAANFRLHQELKVGLVTVDTYRIAAVEQLRTYADILELPMKVVTSPPEMRRAMADLSDLDLVLIDTAGRSPRDELRIQELRSLLNEARVDEVHLVLSLTASALSLQSTAERFAQAGTTSVILSKLDEAPAPGTLLSACRRIPHPVSYLTTGQDVPEDIEPARASRMANLILGREELCLTGVSNR